MRNVPATSLLALAVALQFTAVPAEAQDAPAPAPVQAPADDATDAPPVDDITFLIRVERCGAGQVAGTPELVWPYEKT